MDDSCKGSQRCDYTYFSFNRQIKMEIMWRYTYDYRGKDWHLPFLLICVVNHHDGVFN